MRTLMQEDRILITPAVYDALSAKCVARAGFELTFMTGFGVSVAATPAQSSTFHISWWRE